MISFDKEMLNMSRKKMCQDPQSHSLIKKNCEAQLMELSD